MQTTTTLTTLLCAGLLLGISPAMRAQRLDPSFAPTVLKAPLTSSIQSGVNTLAAQPDGKVLAAGGFDFVNGVLTGKLQRFNADGTVDATFNTGTGVNGFVAAVVVQPNGKILVAGGFSTFNGSPSANLIRLNADGTLDATFAIPATGVSRQPMSLTLLADGKVLLSGSGIDVGGQSCPGLIRLNANGTKDTSFNPGTGTDGGFAYTTLVQPDGKILVGGTFSTFNGQNTGCLARLNADGSHDASFSVSAWDTFGGLARSLAYQPNGKILIGGTFYPNSSTTPTRLVRVLSTGGLDNTFTPGTGPDIGNVNSLLPLSSGAVLVAGSFTQYNGVARGRLVRISADGVLDPNFAANAGANGTILALAAYPTGGEILIGGGFGQYNGFTQPGVARINDSGAFNQGFTPLLESRGTIQQVFPIGDQLMIGGNISVFNGRTLDGVPTLPRRLNADGSLDASFSAAVGGTLLAIPRPGAINAGSLYLRETSTLIRRLFPNGSLDTDFSPRAFASRFNGTSNFSGPVELVGATPLPDGKVLVYGNFSSYDGVVRNGLVRLLNNGTLDGSFIPPASTALPTNSQGFRRVTTVFLQPDGKVLYQWASFTGNGQQFLTRLNTDGSEDTSFSIGTGPGNSGGQYPFFSVLPQPDGKLLISNPAFTSFNGQPAPYGLVRLLANGALDPAFSGVSAYYQPRLVQADGRIVATTAGTMPTAGNQLVQLNSDGSRNTSFTPVAMPSGLFSGDDQLLGVTQEALDSKLVLFGSFRYVAGQIRIGLARLINAPLTAASAGKQPQVLTLYPNPAQQYVTVQLPAEAREVRLFDLQGRLLQHHTLAGSQNSTTLNIQTVPAGLYIVQVASATGLFRQRVMITR